MKIFFDEYYNVLKCSVLFIVFLVLIYYGLPIYFDMAQSISHNEDLRVLKFLGNENYRNIILNSNDCVLLQDQYLYLNSLGADSDKFLKNFNDSMIKLIEDRYMVLCK